MMLLASLAAFGGVAMALPTPTEIRSLDPRQLLTRDDLINAEGDCPGSIFIFARGSTETGNLGSLGPQVADVLESNLDSVWIQGVGGAYDASIEDNFLPDGTSPEAIVEMTGLFELADSTCPDSLIISGGYSQGAALTAATIRDLNASIRDKIVGTVLFGYTKNQQNGGQIPNYPGDRLSVFCNDGDLVCEGQLVVLPPHLAYGPDASGPAPEFLVEKVNAAGA